MKDCRSFCRYTAIFCMLVFFGGFSAKDNSSSPSPAAPPLSTAYTHSLKGMILSKDGAIPVAGAIVTLTAGDVRGNRSTVTDGLGNYYFSELSSGDYRLHCTAEGFRLPDLADQEVAVMGHTTANVEMEPETNPAAAP